MKAIRPQLFAFFFLAFALLAPASTWAQAPLEPTQLPARTSFYVIWRGTPTGDARKSNSLLSLWDDPALAPFRAAVLQNLQSNSAKDPSKPPLSPQEIEQTSTLLENPFVLGYLRNPEAKSATANPAGHPFNGTFFVYDRTGKEALLAKTVLRLRSQEKEPPQISTITVAGAPAFKIERKDNTTTYWTERGKFAAGAADLGVFEEILARLDGKPAASSLAQTAAYQEAQPILHGGLLEFFLRITQLREFTPETPANSPFRIDPILDAIKLDSVHSLSGRLTLEGRKARVQGAVLGKALPGTLFDLWPAGQQTPDSLSFVSPSVVSYGETQFNFSALYDLLKRALLAALSPQQQGGAEMMEGLAAARLGMPVPDALALFSGELASIQSDPAMDPQKSVYYVGIRNKPTTLKLLHTIFTDQLGSERNEGDTTFLKVSFNGGQSNSAAQSTSYHLAVTPNFILASGRGETLRESLAKHANPNPASPASLPPAFQSARAQFPPTINALSFINLQKIDYQAMKARWIEQARKAPSTSTNKSGTTNPQTPPGEAEWLLKLDPAVFARHLHLLAGASWKDSKGIHFDEWLE